tara:strand:- start:1529 stop:1831 length:303 start_codon:yes stop_codon:yes gene_type:complete
MDEFDIEHVKYIVNKSINFKDAKQRSNFMTRIKSPKHRDSFTTKLTIALCNQEESVHIKRLLDDIQMLEEQISDTTKFYSTKNRKLKMKLKLYIEKYGEI